ncbi:MAG: membrane protein insertase YidC [Verrucomicrobia bacterium]|nr:membrane protein insertase YidC [Verrucomicrobiota bacterium]MDA1066901.1 membrane protein insertase YidC [Verrucomicrobiota bacterium]
MDKKNTLLGVLFLLAAFAVMALMNKNANNAPQPEPRSVTDSPGSETSPSARANSPSPEPIAKQANATAAAIAETIEVTEAAIEELSYLENDLIEVIFTNQGGAIKKVAMKEYEAVKNSEDPYLFNHFGYAPMLGVSVGDGAFDKPFTKTFQDGGEIRFERQEANGLLIRKNFWIHRNESEGEPYSIRHNIEFVNTGAENLLLKDYSLHLGTIEPALMGGGALLGGYLNAGYYEDGDEEFITSSKFIASNGFLGIGANKNPPPYITESSRFSWASLKNQFFVSILTPDLPGKGITVRPQPLDRVNDKGDPMVALSSNAQFELSGLGASEKVIANMDFYVGPKEIFRLQAMDRNQEAVMEFGWFGAVSKVLLLGMKQIHAVIPNWGIAIIIITIILKLVFWPLTQISARSAKKMQKIQGPMKELTEKYKEDPKRKNEEMMKLYRKHKVNPVGGCLPMIVQIPIFIGFFYMLRTSSELRFAEFLWISDLSQPEKIFSWGVNLPILGQYFNLLPFTMGLTMFYQMRMTPTAASAEQQAIFKFMPIMMVVMLYNFGSGLCLYWTIQNLMTILQQTITNKRKDKEEIAAELDSNDPNKKLENPLIRKKPKRKLKNQ